MTATNAAGTGPASNALSAIPATVPGAPALTAATVGNGQVALTWTAPASNGGSAINSYTATASPGGSTCSTSGASCTVGGLTNGISYSFTVTATNAVGTGPASNALTATPATLPGAPTLITATPGNGQVALAWTAPPSNGGSAITSYTATASPGGATCTTSGLACTVSGLTNGTTYSFTVTATNALGTGPASNALSATPAAAVTAPGAPTLTAATPGNGQVALAWTAPPSNGGSAITSYTATAGPGGATCTTSGLACTVSGLTNGTTYSFTVTATNAAGTGPASNALSATPTAAATAPGAPTLNSATANNGQVALVWIAPASNGGSPISGYNIYRSTFIGGETFFIGVAAGTTSYNDTTVVAGITYYYQVTAVNLIGESSRSAEKNATPTASVPGAPTLTSAIAGDSQVTLVWNPPASNGGSPVSSYTATASPGGATCTTSGLTCTVGALTNSTSYSFTVTAKNFVGPGPASNALTAIPATLPGAPTLSSATRGNGQVALAWSAPASNGGSTITSYTATASPGGATCSTGGLSCTVGGLTNGTTYSFTVKATNAIGAGPASNALSATPATAPGAPTLASATAGNTTVALLWSASSNGGSPITSYTATASPGGATCSTSALSCTISGLTNGTAYSFTVTATNAVGTGPASNALTATPVAPVAPGAPTLGSATAGNGQVALAWTAPVSDGNSPITGYTATASPGGATCSTSGTSCTVTGLTNGTTYSFTVRASNSVGIGPASNALAATPVTRPRCAHAQFSDTRKRTGCARLDGACVDRRLAHHLLHGDRQSRRRDLHHERPRVHDRRSGERHDLQLHRHGRQRRRHRRILERPDRDAGHDSRRAHTYVS